MMNRWFGEVALRLFTRPAAARVIDGLRRGPYGPPVLKKAL
jgi:hypothetical protein